MAIKKVLPQAGQESVWDYPRPPRLEACAKRIQILVGDVTIAETESAFRVLETSHPPVYYLPPADIRMDLVRATLKRSWCEWKGQARYFEVRVGTRIIQDAAWSYPSPSSDFADLRDHLAFYADRMDACYVDGEPVQPQPGNFYGGWITRDIVGPFKGGPGSMGW
jgi:uncharacterized protein (DUF427 family)